MTSLLEWPDALKLAADALEAGKGDPRSAWEMMARPEQMIPGGDWRYWLLTGGRGSGKTRTGASTLATWILDEEEPSEWGIVAPTYRDAWTTCVTGESGLLAAFGTNEAEVKLGKSKYVESAWRSHGEVHLRNGHVVRADSANDGALRVQGKNLSGAWLDELGLWAKWAVAFDESVDFAVRKGVSKIVATGTPKISRPAARLIRRLMADKKRVHHTRLRTIDNIANLSQSFFESVVALAKGTRLEQQELEGLLLDDVIGALWTRDLIEAIIVPQMPEGRFSSCYVGVDPSDGTPESDEQAYTVVGKASDRKLYVVESFGEKLAPVPFLKKAIQAAVRWDGTLVVEKNHGGAYLIETLLQVMKEMQVRVPYRMEWAGVGKFTRAEPISGLYSRGVVRHVHAETRGPDNDVITDDGLTELEDQMCTWTGMPGERSPDRLDSLVWASLPYLSHTFETSPIPSGPRKYSALREIDAQDEAMRYWSRKAERMRERMGAGHVIPGDGEHDDELLRVRGTGRSNVHEYQIPGTGGGISGNR